MRIPAVFDGSDGLCAQVGDPDLWFGGPDGQGHGEMNTERVTIYNVAKAICSGCPLLVDCGTWALEHDELFGVWGGMTPRQRQALTKRRIA